MLLGNWLVVRVLEFAMLIVCKTIGDRLTRIVGVLVSVIDGVLFIAVTVEDTREGTALVVGLPMNGEGALLIVEEGGVLLRLGV